MTRIGAYGTAVTLENRFLSATESRTLAFRYKRYNRPTLATAGFLFVTCVLLEICVSLTFLRLFVSLIHELL